MPPNCTCLCLEALVYFHLCWAKIFSLACLAAVVLQFSAGFLSHHFSLLLGFQCDSIYMFRLFLDALTGVEQRVLHRGDFLNRCSVVPSYYEPFSFPTAVRFDELIITLGLIFPCLFIDRMFALIRLCVDCNPVLILLFLYYACLDIDCLSPILSSHV